MELSPFSFDNYKDFVLQKIEAYPNKGHGVRRRLALKVGCQPAYISHVLAGPRHFSLEQAEALCRFFRFTEAETDYFLNLLEFNKAGTPQLRSFLKKQLEQKRKHYQKVENRVRIDNEITKEDQAIYYSSWHYQAVRMALSLPEIKSASDLEERLKLSPERILELIEFLKNKGLVVENKGWLQSSDKPIHIGKDSPFISKLHSNWRVHTLNRLAQIEEDDFHYSGLVSLSQEDFEKVREVLMQALLKSHDIIRPSESEKLCVLSMDFYEA